MANQNTKHARCNGFSGAKAMQRGKRDYATPLGQPLNTSKLRENSGKNPYEGGRKEAIRNGVIRQD
jgi:hypothetical protein